MSLFSPYLQRADITAPSSTTVQFAAAGALATRPIKLGALSGRIASLITLPSIATVSGSAGTKYIYASLAAPTGAPYATAPDGLLDHLLSLVSWNRATLVSTFQTLFTGDGTHGTAARLSAVTLVVTTSSTPPDTHHIPLGEVEWDGAAITSLTSYQSTASFTVSAFIHGQCVLLKSGADLVLKARDGQNLVINGTARAVPVAGVSLAPSGLTPGTLYRIYATWTGSAIALVASTTAPATHTNGVEIQTGDASRTYVGEAWIVTGPAWSSIQPVRSRFHDPTPDVLIRASGAPFFTTGVSDATEKSIFGSDIPIFQAGLITTDEFLECIIFGDVLNNTGAGRDLDIRIKLGATTYAGLVNVQDFLTNATRKGWHVVSYLSASGATNAQAARTQIEASWNTAGIAGSQSDDGNATQYFASHHSVAEDTTTALAFNVTLQNEISHASLDARVFSVIVRRMRRW